MAQGQPGLGILQPQLRPRPLTQVSVRLAHQPPGTKNPQRFLYLGAVVIVRVGVGFDDSFSDTAWRNDHNERRHRTEK